MEAQKASPTWISGPRLRERWVMSTSSFYQRLKDGQIPKPEYPFSEHKPFWRVEAIEKFEAERSATQSKRRRQKEVA